MKSIKIILMCIVILAGLNACSDEEGVIDYGNEVEKQSVTIGFDGFNNEDWDVLKVAAEKTNIKYILCIFHHASDGKIYTIEQKVRNGESDSEFFSFTSQLAKGSYYVSVFVSETEITDGTLYQSYDSYDKSLIIRAIIPGDVFYETTSITVGETPVKKILTLSRMLARVDIVALDADQAPEGIDGICVAAYVFPGKFNLKDKTVEYTGSPEFTLYNLRDLMPRAEFITTNEDNPFSFYVFAGEESFISDLNISSITNGMVTINKSIDKVPVSRNKVTRLKGYLFSDPSVGGSIILDDEWDTEVIEETF